MPDMSEIRRYGNSHRWADVVIHRGVAHWVEVAEDMSLDARGQIAQVLSQIDATLETIKSDRTRLLQVLIYIADHQDAGILNELWDAWVPAAHPPVRAMVQVGLGESCKVEMVITAAAESPGAPPAA
jgi:enamine deaminase RidA (YjgF/YER057c/UK114 family)